MKATRSTPPPPAAIDNTACILHNAGKVSDTATGTCIALLLERIRALEAVSRPPVPPSFTPVTLTLETQGEVDGVYALLSHELSDWVGLRGQYLELKPFILSSHTDTMHNQICSYVRNVRKNA